MIDERNRLGALNLGELIRGWRIRGDPKNEQENELIIDQSQEMLGETPQPVAAPTMALLPPSGTPSRLLTCAGTPRKRAPPKNGGGGRGSGGGGGGGGKANKNNGTSKEKRSVASGNSNSLGKAMDNPTGMAMATFGSGNLFPFEVGIVPEMAPRGKKEAKPATNAEVAALRREQALQQQPQPATSATSAACTGSVYGVKSNLMGKVGKVRKDPIPESELGSGPVTIFFNSGLHMPSVSYANCSYPHCLSPSRFDLLRFPCGTEAHPSPSQTNGNDNIAPNSVTQHGHGQQLFPFDAQVRFFYETSQLWCILPIFLARPHAI